MNLDTATLWKNSKILSTTHAEAMSGPAKDLVKRRDNLAKKTRAFDAFRANVGKLEKVLAALNHATKVNE